MAKTKRTRTQSTADNGDAPVKETKEAKLIRLSAARVTKACNQIRLIGNLAAYKPNGDQVDKIMEALGTACARVEARMRGVTHDSYTFTLN